MALRRIYNDSNANVLGNTKLSGKLEVDAQNIDDWGMKLFVADGGGSSGGLVIQQRDGGQAGLDLDVSSYSDALRVTQTGTVSFANAMVVNGKMTLSGEIALPQTSGVTPAANGATPVAVANTKVTASTIVLFSLATVGGTPGIPRVTTRTPGVGFEFASDAGDTSEYDYVMFN